MKKVFFRGLLIIVFLVQILSVNIQFAQAEETKGLPPWTAVADMNSARSSFTLSLLPDNTVLATGGYNGNYLGTSEFYDPTQDTWTNVGDKLTSPRANHTATTLLDGRVLIVGGENGSGILKSAEVYDPITKTWSPVASMVTARVGHTATRLQDGRVLVVGGKISNLIYANSAEIYDPKTNTWSSAGNMTDARKDHATVLLNDGTVLVTGGLAYGDPEIPQTYLNSVELFDPEDETWTTKTNMPHRRTQHFAAVRRDGQVVVAGGYHYEFSISFIGEVALAETEIYDPVANTWITTTQTLYSPRYDATAILDPFDRFILIAGRDFGSWKGGSNWVESWDVDVVIESEDWEAHSLIPERYNHASIQLATGAMLTAGGEKGLDISHTYLSSTEMYQNLDGISHTYTNTLEDGVLYSSGTLLPNGDILITGGTDTNGEGTNDCSNRAYIWSAALDERDDLQSMAYQRCAHSTTLLPDGRVVVIGGTSTAPNGTERNVVETLTNGDWQQTTTFYSIGGHTATLLPDGNILIIEVGSRPNGLLYNPDTGEMRKTDGSYTGKYNGNTATLLTNGKVLIAGSFSDPGIVELYDPATEQFTPLVNPSEIYPNHTATLLYDGKVIFIGGYNQSSGPLDRVLLYNPGGVQTWSIMEDLFTPRRDHSAVLMPDGKVVVTGGREVSSGEAITNRVDIYDPALNSWVESGTMLHRRAFHTALLSTQGNIFIFGGYNEGYLPVNSVERFTFDNSPWLELRNAEKMWQPELDEVTVANASGNFQFTLTGDQLTGDVEASSGLTNQAATNHPLVLTMRIGNGQMKWLNIDDVATDTSFESKSTNQLLNGPFLVFEFASGSRSEGRIALINPEKKVFLPLVTK